MENLLKQIPNVLLLGRCPQTAAVIHALNRTFGIEPYLYSVKRACLMPGILRFRFSRLRFPENNHYLLNTLLAFENDLHERRTSLLVPSTRFYAELVKDNLDALEASFIIMPLPELLTICSVPGERRRLNELPE